MYYVRHAQARRPCAPAAAGPCPSAPHNPLSQPPSGTRERPSCPANTNTNTNIHAPSELPFPRFGRRTHRHTRPSWTASRHTRPLPWAPRPSLPTQTCARNWQRWSIARQPSTALPSSTPTWESVRRHFPPCAPCPFTRRVCTPALTPFPWLGWVGLGWVGWGAGTPLCTRIDLSLDICIQVVPSG